MRSKLTYSNVVSTLCLFLLLGGGAAYAGGHLGKNSVGSKQLKKNAVTAAKIRKNSVGSAKIKKRAVTTAKIKNGAITTAKIGSGAVNAGTVQDGSLSGADVQDGSLSGADIDQGSLNNVRAANVTAMSFTASCSPQLPLPPGVSSSQPDPGSCRIAFPNSILNCTANATVRFRLTGAVLLIAAERSAQIFSQAGEPNVMFVDTYQEGSSSSLPFDLVLVC